MCRLRRGFLFVNRRVWDSGSLFGFGFGVGFAVGFGVGFAVGFGVGFAVGFGVGFAVGFGVTPRLILTKSSSL